MDLATQQGRDELNKQTRVEIPLANDFLRTGKSSLTYKKHPIIAHDGGIFIVVNGGVYWIDDIGVVCGIDDVGYWDKIRWNMARITQIVENDQGNYILHLSILDRLESCLKGKEVASALIISRGGKRHFVCNGDDDDAEHNNYLMHVEGSITTSFECLAQLAGVDLDVGAMQAFMNGRLKIVDCTPDISLPLTKQEKEQRRKKRLARRLGFTYMHGKWHQAATILVRDVQRKVYYLVGQDDGTYFGCELRGKPHTIKAAFEDLTPKEARVPNVLRQGEWFMVPAAKPKDDEVFVHLENFSFYDDPKSNPHEVISLNAVVTKDGKMLAEDPRMHHNQHPTTVGNGWFTFYRNTAVRSVSVEGVD